MIGTLIFDIDGTLVNSIEYDSGLYIQAIRDVYADVKIYDDWDRYTHVTDSGILMQVIADNGIDHDERRVQQVRSRFYELIDQHLERNPCEPVKGAKQLFDRVSQNNKWNVGIATGGWLHTAKAKLLSAGFDFTDTPIISSDDHHERVQIMTLCSRALGDGSVRPIYVGDGLWDKRASSHLGWRFIAVGPVLRGLHEYWIEDFSEPAWDRVIGAVQSQVSSPS